VAFLPTKKKKRKRRKKKAKEQESEKTREYDTGACIRTHAYISAYFSRIFITHIEFEKKY